MQAGIRFEFRSVDDLDAALIGREILIPPNPPGEGARVAMILDPGDLIELIEFHRQNKP